MQLHVMKNEPSGLPSVHKDASERSKITFSDSEESVSVGNLLDRCSALYEEVQKVKHLLQSQNNLVPVAGLHNSFENEIVTERAFLKALAFDESQSKDTTSRSHKLRSSNLPFYETVWSVAKQKGSITGLRQKFRWEERVCPQPSVVKILEHGESLGGEVEKGEEKQSNSKSRPITTKQVGIDVVADCGAEWIKVSLVTEKHLLYDMAKQGWNSEDECESEHSNYEMRDRDLNEAMRSMEMEEAGSEIHLIRVAKNLVSASKQHWYQFGRPRVRFILPRIRSGSALEIDAVIGRVKALGCESRTCHRCLLLK